MVPTARGMPWAWWNLELLFPFPKRKEEDKPK